MIDQPLHETVVVDYPLTITPFRSRGIKTLPNFPIRLKRACIIA